jgi:hypothetical protein
MAKDGTRKSVRMFITHSHRAAKIAAKYGWLPGARYSNLRDVRRFERVGFLDINWKNYNYNSHLVATKITRPALTVARDIDDISDLDRIIDQAFELNLFADHVLIVPKHHSLANKIDHFIPKQFWLGFSVKTKYGGTELPPSIFTRSVHLLGGRPDIQRRLGREMNVVSFDCNRFTLDASFGDYFDGSSFKPHPIGGYERCLEDSIKNISKLWTNYNGPGT